MTVKDNMNKAIKDLLKVKALEVLINECQERMNQLNENTLSHEQLIGAIKFLLLTMQGLFKHLLKIKIKKKKNRLMFWKRNEHMYQ